MLIHKATKQAFDNFCANPAHALIISGPAGAGKQYVARELAKSLLGLESLDNYPYILEVDSAQMNIEAVRSIKAFLGKKTTGTQPIRRVAILDKVDSLSEAGQNALLKSIEEPPADTVLLLTADDTNFLLPTILSRCSVLIIHSIDLSAAEEYAANKFLGEDIKKAHLMSKGYPGLMLNLLSDTEHVSLQVIELARQVLQASKFNRLSLIDEISKSKIAPVNLLQAIEIAIQINFRKAVDNSDSASAQRFHNILRSLQHSQQQLYAKTNTKLVLTRLFLEM